jgi:hypothetical protein
VRGAAWQHVPAAFALALAKILFQKILAPLGRFGSNGPFQAGSYPKNRSMSAFMSRTRVAALAAILMILGVASSLAQLTNQSKPPEKKATEKKEAADKKPSPHPFHGKLIAIDKTAKTISIGKSTYYITSETRIQKGGKPATLEAGVIGEQVGGYVKPGADGKMMATSVNFGPKADAKPAEKKKAK